MGYIDIKMRVPAFTLPGQTIPREYEMRYHEGTGLVAIKDPETGEYTFRHKLPQRSVRRARKIALPWRVEIITLSRLSERYASEEEAKEVAEERGGCYYKEE